MILRLARNVKHVIAIGRDIRCAGVTGPSTSGAPRALAVISDGAKAYAANQLDGTVSVIDLVSETKLTDLPVGPSARRIPYRPLDVRGDRPVHDLPCRTQFLPPPGQPLTIADGVGTGLAPINVPSLRAAWVTAPYLHDGSAKRLQEVFSAKPGDIHSTLTAEFTAEQIQQNHHYKETRDRKGKVMAIGIAKKSFHFIIQPCPPTHHKSVLISSASHLNTPSGLPNARERYAWFDE